MLKHKYNVHRAYGGSPANKAITYHFWFIILFSRKCDFFFKEKSFKNYCGICELSFHVDNSVTQKIQGGAKIRNLVSVTVCCKSTIIQI